MRLRILGCSGAEFPGHQLSGFLIDDALLLDAGTVGAVLTEDEQWRIDNILVTHPHLDHICGIPLLADNIILNGPVKTVRVTSIPPVIAAIRDHLMNGMIWPDFTQIPSAESPVIAYGEIVPEREFSLAGYRVKAVPVNHTVPAVGYRVTKGDATLLYTGDTGPTARIWQLAGEVSALLIEASFPSEIEQLALLTKHLTPSLLVKELAKLEKRPARILVTHMKPQYFDRIKAEFDALAIPGLELLRDGNVYEL